MNRMLNQPDGRLDDFMAGDYLVNLCVFYPCELSGKNYRGKTGKIFLFPQETPQTAKDRQEMIKNLAKW